jgi:hypothetical protein
MQKGGAFFRNLATFFWSCIRQTPQGNDAHPTATNNKESKAEFSMALRRESVSSWSSTSSFQFPQSVWAPRSQRQSHNVRLDPVKSTTARRVSHLRQNVVGRGAVPLLNPFHTDLIR